MFEYTPQLGRFIVSDVGGVRLGKMLANIPFESDANLTAAYVVVLKAQADRHARNHAAPLRALSLGAVDRIVAEDSVTGALLFERRYDINGTYIAG